MASVIDTGAWKFGFPPGTCCVEAGVGGCDWMWAEDGNLDLTPPAR